MAVLLKTNCAHFRTITQERGQTDGARLQRPACQSLAARQDCQLFVCFFLSLLAHERRSHIQRIIYLPVVAFLALAVCSRRLLQSCLDRTSFPLGSPTVFTLARFPKGTLRTATLRLASEVPLVIRNRHVQHFVWDTAILCTLSLSVSHFYPLNGYSKWLAPVTGNSVFTSNVLWDWKWLWLQRWNSYCPTVLNNLWSNCTLWDLNDFQNLLDLFCASIR